MKYLDNTFRYMYIIIHSTSLMVSSLKWNIQSEGVVIGEDVILNCNGTSCPTKRTKKWIGGPDYEVLSFGNASTNPFKYEITGDTLANYGLKIKTISFDDFNHIYTCACGLQHYSEKLKLDDVNYTYPPHIDEQKIDKYRLKVEMEVYPLPKCFRLFMNETQSVNNSITVKSIKYKENLDGSPALYKVWISLFFRDVQFIDCKGYLDIYCEVGLLNYTIIHHPFDRCKGEIGGLKLRIIVIIVISGICVLPLCYCCSTLCLTTIQTIIKYTRCIPSRIYEFRHRRGGHTWRRACRCNNDEYY